MATQESKSSIPPGNSREKWNTWRRLYVYRDGTFHFEFGRGCSSFAESTVESISPESAKKLIDKGVEVVYAD